MKTPKQKAVRKTLENRAAVLPRRIFIVEDHPVFGDGLKQMINREIDLTVCGEAGDYDHALEGIVRLKPDLALVDITLPGRSGLELIKKFPAKNRQLKLLIISMHDEAIYADRVLRAGGDGYIMKQEDPEEIIHAIRDVLGGHIYVSEAVLSGAAKSPPKRGTVAKNPAIELLTDSELEILESMGKGKSNQEMARQFGLSVRAFNTRATQIRRKLNLKSANALIRYAVCWVEMATA